MADSADLRRRLAIFARQCRGIGEALYQVRDELATFRAHNEQAMAHARSPNAKANFRRFMPHLFDRPRRAEHVTAAALAHVTGAGVAAAGDVFANACPTGAAAGRRLSDGTASVNDCFRPSRAIRPHHSAEQIIPR